MRTCWNRYEILTSKSSELRDSMQRLFCSRILGITMGKSWGPDINDASEAHMSSLILR